MRKESVEAKNKVEAQKKMPWAAIVKKVEGGYMGWEDMDEYQTWARQR